MNLDKTALTKSPRNKAVFVNGSGQPSRVERQALPSEVAAEVSAVTSTIPSNVDSGRIGISSDEQNAQPVEAPEEEIVIDRLPPFPVPWRHPLLCFSWVVRTLFGLASLTLLLAISAAVPLVNFWTLGYLLDVAGRVARTGKLRAAFPLLGLAPRFGSIVLGTWLCLLPLRLISGAAADARLIDPDGAIAARWQFGLTVITWLMIAHLCLALARGGGLWCFVRPVKNARWLLARWRDRDYWVRASTAIGQFLSGLNARAYYSQGWRGFLGAFAWLIIPSALYASLHDPEKPGQVLRMLAGGVGVWVTLMWVPLMQTRFAAENRLGVFHELRAARGLFSRAPFAWLFAIVLTYLLALPLYLFKALSPPQDALWSITIIFVVSIFPAKVALGWAYHRSMRREQPAWFVWRWLCKFVLGALVAFYVFLLFFTPAIGEHGRRVLFEHHALLLPVPF